MHLKKLVAMANVNDLIVVDTDDAILIIPKSDSQSIKQFMKNYQANSNNFKLFIQSNSPGELASWVIPIANDIKKKYTNVDIILLLTPCQYASDQESIFAESLSVIDIVYTPKETLKLLFNPLFQKSDQKRGNFISRWRPRLCTVIWVKIQAAYIWIY